MGIRGAGYYSYGNSYPGDSYIYYENQVLDINYIFSQVERVVSDSASSYIVISAGCNAIILLFTGCCVLGWDQELSNQDV